MYYYIINPAAGSGAINQVQEKLREFLKQLGIPGEFVKTTGPGEATKMTRLAIEKGYTTIVAVGGDDTVNEIINGVTDEKVAVGIIPMGASNGLAKHFGLTNWQQACTVLAARRITSYRLMAAGQHVFLSSLSLGFETDLDKNVDISSSKLRSRLGQFKAGWGRAQSYQSLACQMKVDNLAIDCQIFSLSVANQKFLNPLLDNQLVVSLTEAPSNRQLGSYIWQRLRGDSPLEEKATTRLYGTKVLIETEPASSIMVDGKVAGRTPIAIRLTERNLRIITEKPEVGLAGLDH